MRVTWSATIYKKLAQVNGICHATTIGKDMEALLSVSGLIEETKEAFEELRDIYHEYTAKAYVEDLTQAEAEKISEDVDEEAERYMGRAGDLRVHWAIKHGTLQYCKGCGELLDEDDTVWLEYLHHEM